MTYEQMKKWIEEADTIEDVINARDYLEEEYMGGCSLELSTMLSFKESGFDL